MRSEKRFLTEEYVARLNGSPFLILVDYRGLGVGNFVELRKRLATAGAEVHVVKNSLFRLAAQEAGLPDLGEGLKGQLAAVTGQRDISAAAKTIKTFAAEMKKPQFSLGVLGNQRLTAEQLIDLADLPPLAILRARLLGAVQGSAAALVRLVNTPAAQLARVLKARAEREPGALAA